MTIQTYFPKILQQYIECFKVYRFDKGVDIQLFPKGVFEIVFQSNDYFSHHTAYSSGWEVRPKNFIGGLHNKAYSIKPEGTNNFCIAVELKPNTAKYFIPFKLQDFQNSVIDTIEIWGNSAIELSRKINSEKADHHKIQLIEFFLLSKFINQKTSVIDYALASIIASKGFVEVNQLALNASLSDAQFRKRFNEEIGISPSQYCKIVRINSALAILKKGYDQSLTELTYKLGYFDQAHFIKDFKAVAGTSPKKFKMAI